MTVQNSIKFEKYNNENEVLLIAQLEPTLETIKFQIDMINGNPSLGILSMQTQSLNGVNRLCFNIDSKVSLGQYLSSNKLTKEQFLTVLKNIVGIIIESENYFLNEHNFMIDLENIFIDDNSFNAYMIYLPVQSTINQDINLSFKDLIITLTKDYGIDDDNSDKFIQKLLNFLNLPNFNISGFSELLNYLSVSHNTGPSKIQSTNSQEALRVQPQEVTRDYNPSSSKSQPQQTSKAYIPENKNYNNNINYNPNSKSYDPHGSTSYNPSYSSEYEDERDMHITYTVPLDDDIEMPVQVKSSTKSNPLNININTYVHQPAQQKVKEVINTRPQSSSNEVKDDTQVKVKAQEFIIREKYKTSSIITAVSAQLLIVIPIILRFYFDILSTSEFMIVTAAAVILDVGVLLLALNKKKKIRVKVPIDDGMEMDKENRAIGRGRRPTQGLPQQTNNQGSKKQQPQKPQRAVISNDDINNDFNLNKRELVTEMLYDTQCLEVKIPCLLAEKNGVREKVSISKDRFKIGRLPELVDYVCDNKAVGKEHAEIRKVNDEYYLIDLNSRNGTFVNGHKISSSTQVKLKDSDVIALANTIFTFKLD